MTKDCCFKSFRWFLNLTEHSVFDVTISDNVHIAFVSLFTIWGSRLILESRFIEVNLFRHNNGLCAEENLQNGWKFSIPVFSCITSPGAKQTETNFTTSIQIRIESDLATACCHEVHLWWTLGICIFWENIEFICTMSIWCSNSACNQCFHHIDSRLVDSNKDRVGVLTWECVWQISKLLC